MAFSDLLDDLAAARIATRATQTELLAKQQRLREVIYLIRTINTSGGPADAGLSAEYTTLLADITTLESQLATDRATEDTAYDAVYDFPADLKGGVALLSETVPVMLFPVRLETAFNTSDRELLVRIYPDDIAIETHEPALTASEITSGKEYWKTAIDPDHKAAAWDVLCRNFGAPRAAWIALQLTPTNIASNPTDPETLIFPDPATKFESWTQQPHTRVLPDAFIVTAYHYASSTTLEGIGTRIDYSVKLGIDPSDNDANSLKQVGDELVPGPDVEWMYDFSAAEAAGLGIRIPLTPTQLSNGFDRVVVLGVKFSESSETAQTLVEELFDNHHYTRGLSLLKQGEPTSNTDLTASTFVNREQGNTETLAVETGAALFTPAATAADKSDGQVLADALGINYATLQHVRHSNNDDIRNAVVLNNALWQATGGYYLQDMLYPEVDAATAQAVRTFFSNYVIGGGTVPGIRVGNHPYGIIVTSDLSAMTWDEGETHHETYEQIRSLVETFSSTWRSLAENISSVSNTDADPQQVMADMASRMGISHDYYQRTGAGAGYIWNNLVFNGQPALAASWRANQAALAQTVITNTGVSFTSTPRILQTEFLQQHERIATPIVPAYSNPGDVLPHFSGTEPNESDLIIIGEPTSPYTGPVNFIQWLRIAPCTEIQIQDFSATGTTDKEAPASYLYRLLRQSVLLEYFYAAANVHGISTSQLRESDLVNVAKPGTTIPAGSGGGSEITLNTYTGPSRWSVLNKKVSGSDLTAAQYIDGGFAASNEAVIALEAMRDSLEQLENLPSAQLERLTAQHIDTLSFRLDAWRSGLATQRLSNLRDVVAEGETISRNQGVFIGAYGWLENVKVRTSVSTVLPPTENFSGSIETDANNQGFIHAPSVNHAAAAAVLRAGYVSRSDSDRPETLSVNLSSERVRIAMQFIDSMRNGGDLASLLGYQLERALHERYPTQYMDQFTSQLRNKFPLRTLVVPRSNSATTDSVAANSVVNGLPIVRDYRAYLDAHNNVGTGYPASIGMNMSTGQRTIFLAELDRLENILDAIGDLGVAEGVFQTVQGNTVKAKAMMNAISAGKNIPEPDVIKTPRTGVQITNRITHTFEALPYATTVPAVGNDWDTYSTTTPGALAEPSLNAWLKTIISSPQLVRVKVIVHLSPSPVTTELSLSLFGLQPVDLLAILPDQLADDESMLTKIIRQNIISGMEPPAGTRVEVLYDQTVTTTGGVRPFSDVFPLLRQIATVCKNSRYLKPSDYYSQLAASENTADNMDHEDAFTRYSASLTTLTTALNFLQSYFSSYLNNISDFGGTNLYDYITTLWGYALPFGVEQSIVYVTDTEATNFERIRAAYAASIVELQRRLDTVTAMNIAAATTSSPALEDRAAYVESIREAMKVIFGSGFVFIPQFKHRTEEATLIENFYTSEAEVLLDNVSNGWTLTEEWLQGVASTRSKAGDFELMTILASGWDINQLDAFNIVPAQFPYLADGDERWLAIELQPGYEIKNDRVCVGMSGNSTFDPEANQAGLMIDEWVEVIPDKNATTGLAFHFDQPEAKAPQCILLAVTPEITNTNWTWSSLLNIVNDTLNEAKSRAIDYEDLAQTSFGHLLPAVIAPFTVNNSTIGFTQNEVR